MYVVEPGLQRHKGCQNLSYNDDGTAEVHLRAIQEISDRNRETEEVAKARDISCHIWQVHNIAMNTMNELSV